MPLAAIFSAASAAGLLAVFVLAFMRRHQVRTARYLMLTMIGGIWWCLGQLWVSGARSAAELGVAEAFATLGAPILGVGYYFTARSLTDGRYRVRARTLALCAAPLLCYLFLWLLPETGQLATGVVSTSDGRHWWVPSWLFYLMMGYGSALAIRAGVIEARAQRHTGPTHRAQLRSNLFGAILPLVGGALSLVKVTVDGGWAAGDVEFMSAALLGTALLDVRSIYREQFLNLIPIARTQVLDELLDGIIVFDSERRITDLNSAARALLGAAVQVAPGTHVDDVVGDAHRDTIVTAAGRELSLRWQQVHRDTEVLGHVLIIHDITEQEQARRELLTANCALREQLATIEQLRAELAEQAVRDSLTGLFNRRQLAETFAALTQDDRPFSIVVFDLDHFKAINDTRGHAAGDEVLLALAARLRATFEPGTPLFRFGGEEFVAVLADTSVAQAHSYAKLLRDDVEGLLIETCDAVVQVTVSAGVAGGPEHAASPSEVFRLADRALYEAKGAGRNQVAVARAGDRPLAT